LEIKSPVKLSFRVFICVPCREKEKEEQPQHIQQHIFFHHGNSIERRRREQSPKAAYLKESAEQVGDTSV
jgi:hypothetical protein